MVKITLYKNCRFNNSYRNVMAGGLIENGNRISFLEKYLNSLNKFTINVETIYYENSGELIFDYLMFTGQVSPYSEIYDYNYMKVEYEKTTATTYSFTRYCFINSIKIKNECVYLDYEEDIWHSYYNGISGINYSYLSRTRRTNYNNLIPAIVKIPVDYEGNNKLNFLSLTHDTQYDCEVYCILELQTYDLVVADNAKTYREVEYVMVKTTSRNQFYTTINIAELDIQNLMRYMNIGKADNHNYEIGKVFFIPKNLIKEEDFVGNYLFTYIGDEGTPQETTITIGSYKKLTLLYNFSEVKSGIIENNFKNLSIGTFNTKIDLVNNGTDIEYSITLYETDAGLSLLLNCQNQIIDLINDFTYDIPFTGLLSENFAQRKTSMQLESIKNFYARDTNQIKGIMGIGSLGFDLLGAISQFSFFSQPSAKASGLLSSGSGALSDAYSTGMAFTNDKYVLEAENANIRAPKYSNSKSVISNNTNTINMREGLVLFKINSDNDNYVKSSINNYGYVVYEFIDDISKIELNVYYNDRPSFNYNVFKFDYIDIYGKFPREISLKLNEIFINGVKIWYNENFADDNYVV